MLRREELNGRKCLKYLNYPWICSCLPKNPKPNWKIWGERNIKQHPLSLSMFLEGERRGFIAICAVGCPSTWTHLLQAENWTSSPTAVSPMQAAEPFAAMLRKDLCLQYRRKSPSLLKSEFYISRLHLGKGIWTGFPKCSIFYLNIMLRKWSQQSLCFTLKAHPCSTLYSEKKTNTAIFLDSLSIVWDKDRRK